MKYLSIVAALALSLSPALAKEHHHVTVHHHHHHHHKVVSHHHASLPAPVFGQMHGGWHERRGGFAPHIGPGGGGMHVGPAPWHGFHGGGFHGGWVGPRVGPAWGGGGGYYYGNPCWKFLPIVGWTWSC